MALFPVPTPTVHSLASCMPAPQFATGIDPSTQFAFVFDPECDASAFHRFQRDACDNVIVRAYFAQGFIKTLRQFAVSRSGRVTRRRFTGYSADEEQAEGDDEKLAWEGERGFERSGACICLDTPRIDDHRRNQPPDFAPFVALADDWGTYINYRAQLWIARTAPVAHRLTWHGALAAKMRAYGIPEDDEALVRMSQRHVTTYYRAVKRAVAHLYKTLGRTWHLRENTTGATHAVWRVGKREVLFYPRFGGVLLIRDPMFHISGSQMLVASACRRTFGLLVARVFADGPTADGALGGWRCARVVVAHHDALVDLYNAVLGCHVQRLSPRQRMCDDNGNLVDDDVSAVTTPETETSRRVRRRLTIAEALAKLAERDARDAANYERDAAVSTARRDPVFVVHARTARQLCLAMWGISALPDTITQGLAIGRRTPFATRAKRQRTMAFMLAVPR